MILSDTAAERAVLAGVCTYGDTAYLEIADLLQESTFTIDSNKIIYQCLKHIFEKEQAQSIDVATILSTAQELGLSHILAKMP